VKDVKSSLKTGVLIVRIISGSNIPFPQVGTMGSKKKDVMVTAK
jgi:hypothetical protein